MSSPEIPEGLKEELEELLRSGRKAEAIHLLQTAGDLGPKAAKATVFLLSLAMPKERPGGAPDVGGTASSPQTPVPSRPGAPRQDAVISRSGCGSAVVFAATAPILWLLLGL